MDQTPWLVVFGMEAQRQRTEAWAEKMTRRVVKVAINEGFCDVFSKLMYVCGILDRDQLIAYNRISLKYEWGRDPNIPQYAVNNVNGIISNTRRRSVLVRPW